MMHYLKFTMTLAIHSGNSAMENTSIIATERKMVKVLGKRLQLRRVWNRLYAPKPRNTRLRAISHGRCRSKARPRPTLPRRAPMPHGRQQAKLASAVTIAAAGAAFLTVRMVLMPM